MRFQQVTAMSGAVLPSNHCMSMHDRLAVSITWSARSSSD
jgi:hypothetical protein